ncbi:MAG: hypothetical protein ABI580_07320 [Burkholderiaceae bacterium]
MKLDDRALIPTVVFMVFISAAAEAQRAGAADRPGLRPRPLGPTTLPAVENYVPAAAGIFEVVSVRAADGVVRLRASDGKPLDVSVADYVYELSKSKAGDKLKVDFFQPDEANLQVSAAGIWPAQPAQ